MTRPTPPRHFPKKCSKIYHSTTDILKKSKKQRERRPNAQLPIFTLTINMKLAWLDDFDLKDGDQDAARKLHLLCRSKDDVSLIKLLELMVAMMMNELTISQLAVVPHSTSYPRS